MENFIGVLIFIVVVILSLASKAQEARKLAERQKDKELRKPQQLSTQARQKIHGRSEPKMATARQGSTPPAVPPSRPPKKPRPVEQELLESLFGVNLSGDEEEIPQREPEVRPQTREMVERMRGDQERPVPEKRGRKETIVDRARARMGGQAIESTEAPEPRRRETTRRQTAGQQRRQPQVRSQRQPRHAAMHRLFANVDDVRHAVIVSEVLGRPVSMRDDSVAGRV